MADVSPHDDWLEQALRADAVDRSAYIADEGFTSRVLERLPQPAALPAWRRPVIAILWLVLGGAVMMALPGLFYDVFRGLVAAVVAQPLRLPQVIVALAVLGGLAWGSIVYAIREE
jgi:polyferredoxin